MNDLFCTFDPSFLLSVTTLPIDLCKYIFSHRESGASVLISSKSQVKYRGLLQTGIIQLKLIHTLFEGGNLPMSSHVRLLVGGMVGCTRSRWVIIY